MFFSLLLDLGFLDLGKQLKDASMTEIDNGTQTKCKD